MDKKAAETTINQIAKEIGEMIRNLRMEKKNAGNSNPDLLDKILEGYAEASRLAKEHRVRTDVVFAYAVFLRNHGRAYDAIEEVRWLLENDRPEDMTLAASRETVARLATMQGNLYMECGMDREAEPYFREALGLYRGLVLDNNNEPKLFELDMAQIYGSLGFALKAQGAEKQKEAEEMFREALAICRKYESGGLEIATVLYSLADIIKSDRAEEAEEMYREALTIFSFYPAHEKTMDNISYKLAFLLMRMEKKGEAEQFFRQSLDRRRKWLESSDAPSVDAAMIADTCLVLGEICQEQERWDEAIRYYQETLDVYVHRSGCSLNPSTDAPVIADLRQRLEEVRAHKGGI